MPAKITFVNVINFAFRLTDAISMRRVHCRSYRPRDSCKLKASCAVSYEATFDGRCISPTHQRCAMAMSAGFFLTLFLPGTTATPAG